MKKILPLLFVLIFVSACATAKKFLPDLNMLKAKKVQLAEEMTALKARIDKMQIDFKAQADAQLAAVAGVGNTVSKTVSDIKLNGNNNKVNDVKLFELQKELDVKYIELMWKIIYSLCGIIGGVFVFVIAPLITALAFALRYLLASDRINDRRAFDRAKQKEKKEEENA